MKRNKEAKSHEQKHDDNVSINDSITLDDNSSTASLKDGNESVGSHHSVGSASKRSRRKSSNASRASHVSSSQHSSHSGSAFSFIKRKQEKLLVNTTLLFLDLNGTRTEHKLHNRPDTYSSLQREVAMLRPFSRAMFVYQYLDGEKVFPPNFKPSDKFVVRELLAKTPPFDGLYALPVRWEADEYHDARHRHSKGAHSYMGAVSTYRTSGHK